MDVELALKINRTIHDECKDVPHDIGLRITELIKNHKADQLIKNNFSNEREMFLDLINHSIDMANSLTSEGILDEWLEYNK